MDTLVDGETSGKVVVVEDLVMQARDPKVEVEMRGNAIRSQIAQVLHQFVANGATVKLQICQMGIQMQENVLQVVIALNGLQIVQSGATAK